MFQRLKSLFKKQPSKAELDAELEDALAIIRQGDAVTGVGMMERRTSELVRSWPNSPILAHACYNAALANLVAGDNEQSVRFLERAADIPGNDHQSQKDRLSYLMNLGDVLTRVGRLDQAERHLRIGLAEREVFYEKDHPGVAFGLTPLANNLLSQGRAAEALPLIDRAIEINRAARQPEVASDTALRAFIIKAAHGPDAAAFEQWNEYGSALRTNVLYEILNRAEDCQQAETARLAVAVLRELGQRLTPEQSLSDRLNVFVATTNAARVCEDHASRVQAGEQALELAKESGNVEVIINIYEGMGIALDDAGRSEEAGRAYELALQHAREHGDNAIIANVLRNFGLWHAEKESFSEAESLLKEATVVARESSETEMYGRCLAALGIFLQHRGRMDEARAHLEKCVETMPLAHPDRFCAMTHYVSLQQGVPCPCDGENDTKVAAAILEEIVRRSTPTGLLKSISLSDSEGVQVELAREPSEEEVQNLGRVVELAMAEMRKNA